MEGMRGVPHTTINQKPAAIVVETAAVMGNNMDDNDVGEDNVGDDDVGVDGRQWRC